MAYTLLVDPGGGFVDPFGFPLCHAGTAARLEILNSAGVVHKVNIRADPGPVFFERL